MFTWAPKKGKKTQTPISESAPVSQYFYKSPLELGAVGFVVTYTQSISIRTCILAVSLERALSVTERAKHGMDV